MQQLFFSEMKEHLVASSKQIYDVMKNPRSHLRNGRIWKPLGTCTYIGLQVKNINFYQVFGWIYLLRVCTSIFDACQS